MNQGQIFRLTQDVTNPKPDRRSKTSVWAMVTWHAGSLWRVLPPDERTVEILSMRGMSGQICANDKEQYTVIRPNLEPVGMLRQATGVNVESRDTLRAFLQLAESDPKAILSHLWFTGRVTLEELEAVNEALQALDEATYEKFYW